MWCYWACYYNVPTYILCTHPPSSSLSHSHLSFSHSPSFLFPLPSFLSALSFPFPTPFLPSLTPFPQPSSSTHWATWSRWWITQWAAPGEARVSLCAVRWLHCLCELHLICGTVHVLYIVTGLDEADSVMKIVTWLCDVCTASVVHMYVGWVNSFECVHV